MFDILCKVEKTENHLIRFVIVYLEDNNVNQSCNWPML